MNGSELSIVSIRWPAVPNRYSGVLRVQASPIFPVANVFDALLPPTRGVIASPNLSMVDYLRVSPLFFRNAPKGNAARSIIGRGHLIYVKVAIRIRDRCIRPDPASSVRRISVRPLYWPPPIFTHPTIVSVT